MSDLSSAPLLQSIVLEGQTLIRAGKAWFMGGIALVVLGCHAGVAESGWPAITHVQRPWTYWWWMASAVDQTNITRELMRYRDAGLGGVHVIPIYGARGFESKYISYLSPRWMEMLDYTVREAKRLGLGVDMTTGSGWCFGGPRVRDDEANASLVTHRVEIAENGELPGMFSTATHHAIMAFGPNGGAVDLLRRLKPDGTVDWKAEGGSWRVVIVSQRPAPQKVKRAGPGGEGWMLNLFHAPAMTNFLAWMETGFSNYTGAMPRAQYHDSYEYKSEWAPDFFVSFEKRRGYRLQDELPALLGEADPERSARVKCDYRETISELMSDVTLPLWAQWRAPKAASRETKHMVHLATCWTFTQSRIFRKRKCSITIAAGSFRSSHLRPLMSRAASFARVRPAPGWRNISPKLWRT